MLSITGTKALFADQSHFPVPSIQIASTTVVFPCLLFAYSGQAAYLIKNTCHKQLSLNDSRLSSTPPPPKWKRKIDSPVVEAAVSDFIDQILKDFVVDLWYSEITPDREAPELMRSVIMDALGEISGRAKEINLIDLLTRQVFLCPIIAFLK
uniref:PXA domain-containing protein n=1 Tax=Salix viminalis TaxID=40686 RepID=A0A6N2MJY2_SALVM